MLLLVICCCKWLDIWPRLVVFDADVTYFSLLWFRNKLFGTNSYLLNMSFTSVYHYTNSRNIDKLFFATVQCLNKFLLWLQILFSWNFSFNLIVRKFMICIPTLIHSRSKDSWSFKLCLALSDLSISKIKSCAFDAILSLGFKSPIVSTTCYSEVENIEENRLEIIKTVVFSNGLFLQQ